MLSGCGGGPTSTPTAATVAPAATSAPATALVLGGGVSITSVLGGNLAAPPATAWVRISDPASPFSFEVPTAWTILAANPWTEGTATIGSSLAAGPDLSKLSVDFSVPGVVIGISAGAPGITPRQIVEGGGSFGSVCTAGAVEEASEAGAHVAYQLWTSCGGGAGVLLVMAIAPAGQPGLLGIVYQGTRRDDLGYLDRIVGSILPASAPAESSAPVRGGEVSGPTYAITMDVCQNQHGQGVSGGLIRNTDALIHTYRIVVAFSDANGVFLNDTAWTTSDLDPGVTARWQASVPSGLPAVNVTCQVKSVTQVR